MAASAHRAEHNIRAHAPAQARWRQWFLVAILIAFLSVFSTGLTHYHKNEAEALDCPVCHVVGHQALDAHTPDLVPNASAVLWLLLSLSLISIGRKERSPCRCPSSRAPPYFL